MIGLLLRCYPERWRARYGEEFAALLAERPLGPFDVADVLIGALDARLHLRALGRSEPQGGPDMMCRIGGLAAVVGGLLWLLVFVMSVTTDDLGVLGMALLLVGTLLLLVALTGLSAFQAHRHPRLVWAAFLIPASGAVISVVGVIGMATVGDRPFLGASSPWYIWIVGAMGLLLGSALFGLASWRVGALPRFGSVILVIGAVAIVPVLSGLSGGVIGEDLGRVVSVLAMAAFGGGWILLGVGALRGARVVAVTPPSNAG